MSGPRIGVALSSAFFGFYAHTGFLKALTQRGIVPDAYSGASAGALVAAFAGAGALAELEVMLGTLRRADFWDPGLPTGRPLGLLKGRKFRKLLDDNLPAKTFADCVKPVVTVSVDLDRKQRHIDDSGSLAEAVHASCALPFLFRPVMRGGVPHVDGGLIDKVPISALIDRHDLDVVYVHQIPSSGLDSKVPRAPLAFLDQALDVSRDDGWRQQVALAEARGIEVRVITTNPTRVSPFKMRLGRVAMADAEAQTLAQLG